MSLSPPSTFLRVAGSCTVVDKNAHTIGAIHIEMFPLILENVKNSFLIYGFALDTFQASFLNSVSVIPELRFPSFRSFSAQYFFIVNDMYLTATREDE